MLKEKIQENLKSVACKSRIVLNYRSICLRTRTRALKNHVQILWRGLYTSHCPGFARWCVGGNANPLRLQLTFIEADLH
jgi:hypothetical protein